MLFTLKSGRQADLEGAGGGGGLVSPTVPLQAMGNVLCARTANGVASQAKG